MLTVPSPTGAIHPYPAIGLPFASGIPSRVSSHVSLRARAVPVAPGRDAVRPVAFAGRAERAPESTVGTVGDHDEARPDLAFAVRGRDAVRRGRSRARRPERSPRDPSGRTRRRRGRARGAVRRARRGAARHRDPAGRGGSATARSARVRRRSSGRRRPGASATGERVDVEQPSSASDRGVSTSPHALCRGTGRFSTTVTAVALLGQPQCDRRARRAAADHEHVGVERAHDTSLTPT